MAGSRGKTGTPSKTPSSKKIDASAKAVESTSGKRRYGTGIVKGAKARAAGSKNPLDGSRSKLGVVALALGGPAPKQRRASTPPEASGKGSPRLTARQMDAIVDKVVAKLRSQPLPAAEPPPPPLPTDAERAAELREDLVGLLASRYPWASEDQLRLASNVYAAGFAESDVDGDPDEFLAIAAANVDAVRRIVGSAPRPI